MELDYDLHMAKVNEKDKTGKKRKQKTKRFMAVFLSAVLVTGLCLPAMAVEQPEVQTEESAEAVSTGNEQADEGQSYGMDRVTKEDTPSKGTVEEDTSVEETTDGNKPAEEASAGANEVSDGAEEQQEEAADLDTTDDADAPNAADDGSADAAGEETEDENTGETSAWLTDYEYGIDEDGYEGEAELVLTNYYGADTSINVPGTAIVNGVEYHVTIYSAYNMWSSASSLAFGQGFRFPVNSNGLFSYMGSLLSVDMSQADTSRVQSMSSMFEYCSNLQSVNMNGIDTSSVSSVYNMFQGCYCLEEIDLSCFSGSLLNDVSYMFEGCDSLHSINLNGCDFSNVSYLGSFFDGCGNLEELVTPVNVQDEYVQLPVSMVDEDGFLYTYLPAYNSSSIILTKAELPEWLEDYTFYVSNSEMTIDLQDYFGPASEIVVPGSVTLGGHTYQVVSTMGSPWKGGVTSLSFEEGFVLDLQSNYNYFASMTDLETLDLHNVGINSGFNGYSAISGCSHLKTLYLPADFEEEMRLPNTFKDDDGNRYTVTPTGLSYSITLHALEISPWLENYTYSIRDDESAVYLERYNGHESEIVVPDSAVIEGTEYTKIVVYGDGVWESSNAVSITFESGVQFGDNAACMFSYMHSLTSIDFSAIGTQTIEYCPSMFYGCGNLTEVDLSMFDFSGCWYTYEMFEGCSSLETIKTPVNVVNSINLPGTYMDDEGNFYTEIPSGLTESITLTKAEQSEWLDEYRYEIVGDAIYLTYYTGYCSWKYDEETGEEYFEGTITVPGSATIGTREFNKIVISQGIWGDSGVEELIFESGVALPESSYEMFGGLDLKSIDLSEVDVTEAERMDNMFKGCRRLTEIKAPKNVTLDAVLPAAYADENGNIYSCLPYNLTESITLTKVQQSEWLDDFEYHIDGNKIVLAGYYGNGDNVITVYGSAEVAGRTYSQVEFTQGAAYGMDGTLTFEQGVVFPNDCSDLFQGGCDLISIDLSKIDTANVINMSGMFGECYALMNLDVSGMDTSNVTDMSGMFRWCDNLTELDVSNFDTSNVTDMNSMFAGCYSLLELDVSGFDTSSVTDMAQMFYGCSSLTELNLAGIDTSNVTNMSDMFSDCRSLTELDVSGFDTSSCRNMESMFFDCEGITSLNLNGFDTSNVITMSYMFYNCNGLTELNVSGFDTSKTKNINRMFIRCGALSELDLSNWDMSALDTASYRLMTAFTGDIPVIIAPANVPMTVRLGALYQGSDGFTYNSLPINAGRSIILTWISESGDPTGNISGDPSPTPITIVTQPRDIAVRNGDSAVFTVEANGNNLSYQWQWSSDASTWKNCTSTGYNTSSFGFKMRELYAGRFYRCQITNGTETVYTDAATITLKSEGEFVAQPVDVSAAVGETVTFSIEFDGTDPAYQWQWSKDGSTWSNCTAGGYNTEIFSFTMKALFSGRQYRCVVTEGSREFASDAALLTLAEETIEIVTQPADAEAAAGETVTFTVESNGTNPAYQWQWSKNGTTWTNCASGGYNTDTLSFAMKTIFSGRQYRCVVTEGSQQVISDAASLTLAEKRIEIVTQPADAEAAAGETVTFTVESNGTNPAYQWQWSKNGTTWTNCTSGGYNTNTFSFTMKATFSGRQYRCVVSEGSQEVTSEAAALTLAEKKIEIVTQPADTEAAVGETVTFTVKTNGTDPAYQWQWSKNGTTWNNCTSGGYNTDTFSFTMKALFSGRQYRCVVTEGGEEVLSEAATLILAEERIEIVTQPADVAAAVGETVTFTVKTNGTDPAYQWQWSKDGTTWNNCTSGGYNTDTFSFTMKASLSGRRYRCVVTVGGNTLTSDAASITLK